VASIVLVNTAIFVVDIAAFRPLVSVSQIGPASLTPRKHACQHLSWSTFGRVASSDFSLKSVGDDKDVVLLQRNQTSSDDGNNDDNQEDTGSPIENDYEEKVDALLALLDSVPSNLPTSKSLTDEILAAVDKLEDVCPVAEEDVLPELTGNWELLWTAQDRSSGQFRLLLNPLENQSYSNNPFRGRNPFASNDDPGGRANPVLPREIQDILERTGVLEASGGSKIAPIRSSQGVDLKRKRVRNVVNVQIKRPFLVKGSVIVDLDFEPNARDKRRIDVKFESCRLVFQNARLDQTFPLGIFGPRGWLRTEYIDDRIRITRGHKGSVFILSRTAKRRSV